MTSNKGKGTNNRLATAALWYYATEVLRHYGTTPLRSVGHRAYCIHTLTVL